MEGQRKHSLLTTSAIFLAAGILSFVWSVGWMELPRDARPPAESAVRLRTEVPPLESPASQPPREEPASHREAPTQGAEPQPQREGPYSLAGRVLDCDATPLVGAPLWIEGRGTTTHMFLVPPIGQSGPDGTFLVKLPEGRSLSNLQLRSHWVNRSDAILEIGDVRLPAGGTLEGLDLRFPPTTRVVVHARTVNGTPAPDLGLCLYPHVRSGTSEEDSELSPQQLPLKLRRWTDREGRAEFGELEPGEYALRAEDPSIAIHPQESIVKLDKGGSQTLKVTVDDLGTVHGFATRGSQPLAGAELTLEGPSVVKTMTEPNGAFRFPPVLTGKYAIRRGDWTANRLTCQWATTISQPLEIDHKYAALLHPDPAAVEAARRDERWILVRSGENSVSLSYEEEPEARPLVLRVVDRTSKAPVAEARCRVFAAVCLSDPTFPTHSFERPFRYRFGFAPQASTLTNKFATSDSAGYVKVGSIPEGRYVFTVRAPHYRRARGEFVVAGAPNGAEALQVELERGARITGVVLDPDGGPVRSAWVAVVPDAVDEPFLPNANIFHFADDPPSERTDAAGQFVLSGMDPGPVKLVVWSGTRSPVVCETSAPAEGILCRLSAPYGQLQVRAHRSGAAVQAASVFIDYPNAHLMFPASVLDLDVFFQTVAAWIREPKYRERGEVLVFDRVLPSEALPVQVRDVNINGTAPAIVKRIRLAPGETVTLEVDLDVKEDR